MINATRTLYVGVTNDLQRRVYEHKCKPVDGFAKKYDSWLACYEATDDVSAALPREKQLKRWNRSKKLALVESSNPHRRDVAQEWYVE